MSAAAVAVDADVAAASSESDYMPLRWQVAPWRDRSGILLLTGSAGGGKSHLAAEKCVAFCKAYPGAMVLICRKTLQSLRNSTMLFIEEHVLKGETAARFQSHSHRWRFSNGSVLAFGGMANPQQRIATRSIGQTGGLDMLWLEEATQFSEADFDDISGRMRGKAAPWRQIIISTNPDTPAHWIYKRMIQGGGASVYYSGAKDNRHNPPDYVNERLAKMPGPLGLRLREGKWVGNEGMVYADFDPAVHVLDDMRDFAGWREWPLYRAIDFGYRNPFVCQWWVQTPDDELILVHEIYKPKLLVDRAAELILDAERRLRMRPGAVTYADHDAGDRAMLAKYGVYSSAAKKDVKSGIREVQRRMQLDDRGKPGLYFRRDALVHRPDPELLAAHLPACTLEEIPGYAWVEPNWQASNWQARREEPCAENDHGCDAMRYLVFSLVKRAGFSL